MQAAMVTITSAVAVQNSPWGTSLTASKRIGAACSLPKEASKRSSRRVVATPKATAILCDNYIVTEIGVSECLHKFPKTITVV